MSTLMLTGCPPSIESSLLEAISAAFSDHARILLCGLEPLQIFDLPACCSWTEAPRNSSPLYGAWLEDVCRNNNVTEIIPLIDSEVEFFWTHINSDGFYKNAVVWVSPSSKIDLIVNKKSAYENCPSDFCPIYFSITKPEEIRPALECHLSGGDFVSRPISGVNGSGKGVRFVRKESSFIKSLFYEKLPSSTMNADEYIRLCTEASAIDSLPPQLITEFLPGTEYSCYVVCDRGKLKDIAVQRKLRNQEGSTSSGEAIIVKHAAAVDMCREIARAFDLDLLNNIQIRMDADGNLKLVEINPRLAGSINLAEEFQCGLLTQTRALLSDRLGERYPSIAWRRDSQRNCNLGSIIRQTVPKFLSVSDLDSRCLIRTQMRARDDVVVREQFANFTALIEGIETVIFDLDNTLYDEFSFIKIAAKELLEKNTDLKSPYIENALSKLEDYYNNVGNDLLFDKELAQHFSNDSRAAVLEDFLSILRDGGRVPIQLSRPQTDFLSVCKAHDLNLFCITDGNPAQQRRKVDSLELGQHFSVDHIIFSDLFGGKSSPNCAKTLKDRFAPSFNDPRKVLVIGDSAADECLARFLECWFVNYSVNKR